MSTDNVVLVVVCGLGVVAALTMSWRWRDLSVVASVEAEAGTPPASVGFSFFDSLRTLAAVLTAGIVAGTLVIGLGGRLVMRVLAATSGSEAQGRITDAEEVVGEITFGGSFAFVFFVGILPSLVFALGLLVLRHVLPSAAWMNGLVYAVLLLGTFGVADALSPDNIDFGIVAPVGLAVALVVITALLYGTTLAALVARLDRAVPPIAGPRVRRSWAALAYSSFIVVVSPLAVPTAVYVAGRTVLRGRVGSLIDRPWVVRAAHVVLGLLVAFAAVRTIDAVASIL